MSPDYKPVTSGVPQGTVLGPLLFLIYINDLPNCVNLSTIRLFADDCLIYKEIHSQHDTDDLQADLDALQTWERRWLMSFHPQKCQLLRITRKPSPIIAQYNIHGQVLEVADTAKYLGVTLHKYYAWSKHISQRAKKANNTGAFLQGNLRRAPTSGDRPTRLSLGPFWSMLALSGTHTLNQTFTGWRWRNTGMLDTPATTSAAPVASLLCSSKSVGRLCRNDRRAKSRLAMQFCIAHNLVDVPAAGHLQTYNSRKGNATKFRVPYARTVAYRHSFFPDVTRMWNALPPDVVTAESLDLFKTRLSLLTIRVRA